jgi:hypothetical protein
MESPTYSDLMSVVDSLESSRADVKFLKNFLFRFVSEFLTPEQWNRLMTLAWEDTSAEQIKPDNNNRLGQYLN